LKEKDRKQGGLGVVRNEKTGKIKQTSNLLEWDVGGNQSNAHTCSRYRASPGDKKREKWQGGGGGLKLAAQSRKSKMKDRRENKG